MAKSDGRIEGQAGPGYFPMFLNLERKKFLVFGAGQVAARRVGVLLRFGAQAVVVAPRVHAQFRQLSGQYPGRLQIIRRPYRAGEIAAARVDYVVAATDHALVNDAIVEECRSAAVPVNNAADRTQCDYYFPALVEQGHLVMGINRTDGDHKKTAKISAMLREKLQDMLKNIDDDK